MKCNSEVPIVPSRGWSQLSAEELERDSNAQPSLLGLSMRMCNPELALDNVWHVLDVLEGSPAESAGLVPYGDYITGWSGGALSAENDFYDLVETVSSFRIEVGHPLIDDLFESMSTSRCEYTSTLMISSKHSIGYRSCLSHMKHSALREVVLVPNRHWGGEGLLGCVFG